MDNNFDNLNNPSNPNSANGPNPSIQPHSDPPKIPPQEHNVKYEKIDKKILKKCRHKAELRWYRRLLVLNILIIAAAIGYFIYSIDENREYIENVCNSVVESANQIDSWKSIDIEQNAQKEEQLNTLKKQVANVPKSIVCLIEIIFLFIAVPFIISYTYAQYRSMSVRITEKTYPEIYAIVEEYSQKLGLKRVPKVYMIQGNGLLNAFSSFIPFRQYIEIYADLLEVAYREHHDMDTIRFIIAHEMGHIYYKHSTMHYYYSIMLSQVIPILGSTASRTREYSCDRLAQLLSGSDGIDAMMMLTAGIHLYKQVDKQDYIDNAKTVNGFFIFCYNLASTHPIMSKRVLALDDPQQKSGKLY